jgi:molybdopterin/thiamine biosynthesis adenylyltransferase
MRKIMIIGAGGIGSFLIPLLDKTGLYQIHIYDPDIVETKNLTYQNFSKEEVGELKVNAMAKKYTVKANKYPVLTEEQMLGYDLVVCCVDNLDCRRTLYRTKIEWLDLRAQGRNAALVSFLADPEQYDTLLAGPEGSFSCQGDSWDGSTKNVHFMQVAIAGIGAQWIQRWFNKEDVSSFKVVNA